ncbi:hypothetical protein FRB94_008792 [Tulasnella sp. JGI-2019a]|nr:hypothetical protein FRB93_001237 [Tulasnella sp. JGI-2019a]KAG8995738.1 hypothetical protein FRB94_008792 [Tulasnella sp. JGI-2019a]KAG9026659.1 hypothetical protein FRB95_008629 [Tulasnella sp. JGI-2019a]
MDQTFKAKEQGEEARYVREKEQAQLAALRDKMSGDQKAAAQTQATKAASQLPSGDIEGGFGGQEDLEDRYATTSGEN